MNKQHERSSPARRYGNRRNWLTFLIVAATALILRVLYLWKISSFALYSVPLGDARSYLDWATRIAAGDWLSLHQGVFYQAPLYSYVLAMTSFAGGDMAANIRILQVVAAGLACGLLAVGVQPFVGRRAAVAAGVLLAVYPPALFTDGLIGKESLALSLAVVQLVSLAAIARNSSRRWLLTCGVSLALGSLLRENTLLLIPVVLLWLVLDRRQELLRHRLAKVIVVIIGAASVLLPVAVRNLVVGGHFTVTTSQSGPNFYIGNNAKANGTYVPLVAGRANASFERTDAIRLAEQAVGRSLVPSEVSQYWWRQSLSYIVSHPADWLLLTGRKLLMVFHAHELPDTDDYLLYRDHSSLLRGFGWFWHMGVLAPLSAVGVMLTWQFRRRLWLLHLMLVVSAASVAAFFVLGRYRITMLSVLVLFAGAALVGVYDAVRRGPKGLRLQTAAFVVVVAVAVAVACNWPLEVAAARTSGMSHSNLGAALAGQGRLEAAVREYRKALLIDPDLIEAHLNLGSAYFVTGRIGPALEELEIAAKLAPMDAEVAEQLAIVLERQGERDQARETLNRALKLAVEARDQARIQSIRRRLEAFP